MHKLRVIEIAEHGLFCCKVHRVVVIGAQPEFVGFGVAVDALLAADEFGLCAGRYRLIVTS